MTYCCTVTLAPPVRTSDMSTTSEFVNRSYPTLISPSVSAAVMPPDRFNVVLM